MKIQKKYVLFVFGGITSTVVSLAVAFTAVLINEGLTANFLTRWLRSFGLAFIVAYPTVLVVVPLVGRLMERITADEESPRRLAETDESQTFARINSKEI